MSALAIILLLRVFRGGSLAVHSLVIGVIGAVVFVDSESRWRSGPGSISDATGGCRRSQKDDPELVTSGPYRLVRHPIYSGILLGVLGTALASSYIGLIIVGVLGAYFYYSATVEEKNLTATFPSAYPDYRSHTKMLIPFVL